MHPARFEIIKNDWRNHRTIAPEVVDELLVEVEKSKEFAAAIVRITMKNLVQDEGEIVAKAFVELGV